MFIILNLIGDNIVGSVNGKQFGIPYDAERYKLMQELQHRSNEVETMDDLRTIEEEFLPLTKADYKELVQSKSPYIFVNRITGKSYLKYGDKISSKALPQVFVDKIIQSIDKQINVDPLIKCWARYMRPVPGRPEYSEAAAKLFAQYIDAEFTNEDVIAELMKEQGLSHAKASEFATTKQVAITQEGLLVCYKVSSEVLSRFELNENEERVEKSRYGKSIDPDTGLVTYNSPDYVEDRLFLPYVMKERGDAFWSQSLDGSFKKEGHFIRVGHLHYLDSWEKVGRPGQKGLHCGGLRYIAGYQQEGTVTHNIFVDPMHIHTIGGLGNGNDGAMTVKQYFVHSSFAGVNRNIYHSSKYAALTDAEYAKLVEEAVTAHEAKAAELAAILEENRALGTVTATSRGGLEGGDAKLSLEQ